MILRRPVGIAAVVVVLLLAIGLGTIGQRAERAEAKPQIGENSCQGEDACTGLTAHVGDNSCNGFQACLNNSGKVGDGSCNGDRVCTFNSVRLATAPASRSVPADQTQAA